MTRDPKTEPQFGDVFHYEATSIDDIVVYLRRLPLDTWAGLNIRTGGITEGYTSTKLAGWEFVETIDGRAAGGLLPWEEAVLRRSGIDPANLTAKGLRTVLHHINGDPTDNRPENLRVAP